MLGDTLRRYLAGKAPIDVRNKAAYGDTGYSPGIWRGLAELGVIGALFDEAAGGFGGGGFDIMVVFHEIGRALAVEPFLGALMVGQALAAAGRPDAIEGIVAGTTIAAFAHAEPQDRATGDPLATQAHRDNDGWTIDGAKAVVAHGEAADVLLVSAQTDTGIGLFLVPRDSVGLTVRGYANIDGGRSAEVALRGVTLPDAALVTEDGAAAIAAAEAAGLLALSAEALGAMEIARDHTVDYVRTRKQFGVPIGKFQALQHRIATMLLEIEQARSAVINAADAFATDAAARALAAAKYTVGATGQLVAEEAIQLHGGIGMTWELPLSHYAKRISMIDGQLGDQDQHLQRYIALGRADAGAMASAG